MAELDPTPIDWRDHLPVLAILVSIAVTFLLVGLFFEGRVRTGLMLVGPPVGLLIATLWDWRRKRMRRAASD